MQIWISYILKLLPWIILGLAVLFLIVWIKGLISKAFSPISAGASLLQVSQPVAQAVSGAAPTSSNLLSKAIGSFGSSLIGITPIGMMYNTLFRR